MDEDFIQDEFNLYGLSQSVPNYEFALDMILDNENEEELTDDQQEIVERNAEMLYGLIHARFITTPHGQQLMLEKFRNGEFGRCPRVHCNGQAVLPVGLTDVPQQNTVKLFCPKCQDIYFPKNTRHATVDGAYFGTTFPHLLLLQYPDAVPQRAKTNYVPKIFGFKLHPSAISVQRNMIQSNNQGNNNGAAAAAASAASASSQRQVGGKGGVTSNSTTSSALTSNPQIGMSNGQFPQQNQQINKEQQTKQ